MELGIPKATIESQRLLETLPNVAITLSSQPDRRQTTLLVRTLAFLSDSSRVVGDEFLRRFQVDRESQTGIQIPNSVDLIKRRGFHLPQFSVYDQVSGEDFLEKTTIDTKNIETHNLLLVFQLPPLIHRHNIRKYEEDSCRNSNVNWEKFSRPVKKVLRKRIKACEDKERSLKFLKLNEMGQHDTFYYHYVWEVGFPDNGFHSLQKNTASLII